MVLGHESSGTVIDVGPSVRSLIPGDPVAMEPGIPCRRCFRCKEGRYNLCPDMAFAATPPYDGTLAKYYVLPEDFCYKLPKGMSLEEGALIEPLAVAVHIARQAKIRHGDRVVVFGAGPVGLLICAVAREFGAAKIIAVDIQKQRLEFASGFAATATFESRRISAEENARNLIEENDLGKGADVAIDASGAEPAVQTAIHVLKTGGTYVQGGMGKEDMNFPIMACCTKELTVKGSFRYGSGDYKLAVELVAAGKVKVSRMITRKVRFEDAEQAFMDIKAARGIKVLICGSGEDGSEVEESTGVLTVESNGVEGTQHAEPTMDGMKDIQDSEMSIGGMTSAQNSEMKTDTANDAHDSGLNANKGTDAPEHGIKTNGLPAPAEPELKATENDGSPTPQNTLPQAPQDDHSPIAAQHHEIQPAQAESVTISPENDKMQAPNGDARKAAATHPFQPTKAEGDGLKTTPAQVHVHINGAPVSDLEGEAKQEQEPAPAHRQTTL